MAIQVPVIKSIVVDGKDLSRMCREVSFTVAMTQVPTVTLVLLGKLTIDEDGNAVVEKI